MSNSFRSPRWLQIALPWLLTERIVWIGCMEDIIQVRFPSEHAIAFWVIYDVGYDLGKSALFFFIEP